jgi:UDP-N-acetylmuramoyl-L-alanyl-D-glutamate--2,6-diaminopimelate ligase
MLITGIAYHSARVQRGDLFVAVEGFSSSGRDFISDAIARGATAIASQQPGPARKGVAGVTTGRPRQFLASAARAFYDFPDRSVKLIGVTGTNGKTTTTYLVRSILEAAGQRSGLIGTIRHFDGQEWRKAENTTPESLDIIALLARLRTMGIVYCVLEVSSHGIALDRVHGLEFAVAVFTNLSQDHLDFHKSMDEYKQVKLRLFQGLTPKAWAVYNADDPVGAEVKAVTRARTLSYRLGPSRAATFDDAEAVSAVLAGMTGSGMTIRMDVGRHEDSYTTGLVGRHNVYNIMAAAGVGYALNLDRLAVKQGIQRLKSVPGRLERVDNRKRLQVFVDYAHSPDALEKLLKTARELTANRVLVVFGCGGNRDKAKRPLMGRVASELADTVIVTSDNPRDEDPLRIIEDVKAGICKSNFEVEPNRYAAIKRALFLAGSSDIVLIAGKGHEDYQVIGQERHHFDDRETVQAILGKP